MKFMVMLFLAASSMLFGQWSAVNVYPLSGQMTGFHLSDSLNITAVYHGDSSQVIRSSDGGRKWSVIATTPTDYANVVSFVDKDTFFIAGSYPLAVYKTIDGGLTWDSIAFPSGYVHVKGLQFLDSRIGYALLYVSIGTFNVFMKTTDGGSNWSVLDSTISQYRGFKFVNRDEGWIFGNQLLHTTNGGNSFTQMPLPAGLNGCSSLDRFSDSIMVLGSRKLIQISPYSSYYAPQVAFSTNNGASWNVQEFPNANFRGTPANFTFLDENTAISFLAEGNGVLYTTDKGQNWSAGQIPLRTYQYNDIQVKNKRVYVAGVGSVFLVSGTNIADPWDVRLENTLYSHRGFDAKNPGSIVIGTYNPGSESKVFVSTDRGENWKTAYFPSEAGLCVEIASDSVVYISSNTQIYKSDISCEAFTPVGAPFNLGIQEIKAVSNGNIVVGTHRDLRLSTDHGETWTVKITGSSRPFISIDMFADGSGFAISNDLYRTTDYGNSWTGLGITGFTLKHAGFYDGQNGFIIGYDEKIYRTRNAGSTFEAVTFPGLTKASYIYCYDSLNYFLCGNKPFSTYDGGLSWKENETVGPSGRFLYWVHMFDHFDGVALNSDGLFGLWMTHNRGNTPVELSGFSAVSLGNKVALQWTTETETNNMGFEIERRFKHGDWKTIGFSKGSGTSTKRIFYGFDDHEPKAPAILYYRLKQIDYDGRSTYSNEIEVILGEVPENYSIAQNYPNPFNPSTKVSFTLPEENEIVIRVFNAMGELVKEFNRGILPHGYFDQEIDMADAPSGVYVCQVFCTNTVTARTKSLTTKMVLLK